MAFPWNSSNKNDSRQLEEVIIFHPTWNTAPDPRNDDVPVGCTAAMVQTQSQSRGNVTGCSGSTGNPMSSSRSKWRTVAMSSISCLLRSWGRPLIITTSFCYLILGTKLLFFFLMSFLLTPNPNPNQTSFFFFNVFFTHTSWRCEKKIIKKEVWSANKQIEHPWWLRCKKIRLQSRRLRFDPWVRKIPWRREWQPTPVFLPGEFDGQRSLATSYSPCGCKGTDMTERLTHTQISN